MTSIFRTAAIAAASLGFAAAIASAAPSIAGENAVAQPVPVYTDHASATIAPVATPPAPEQSGGLRAVGRAIKAALPGVQYPAQIQAQPLPFSQPLNLEQMIASYTGFEAIDAEKECLARAIYYEARGEPLEGQLAVANVVLNRAASGRYPASLCAVVRQPAQFSFVRRGHIPAAPRNEAWRKAVGIAHVASARFASGLTSDVLWYHADYVAPSWGRRLNRVAKIGAHIFYS
ncbi:cell wall hydrolase [Allosphingosinicella vermicomposti]|uniref:cell wall hydrolase n=1 Tax=Allosphingosinicella vermicomposti TaxID=614671 RepID=UPI000D0ECC6F|nr:cell wall hydrolase [Allosphingosinicella vermicomposti]